MCQIGDMEGFVIVENYTCGVVYGGSGDTGCWHNVAVVAMEDLGLDVEMAI